MVNNMVKHLEKEKLTDLIKEGTTLVDFYAEWCGPCKMLAPVLESLDTNVVKVDVDIHAELAQKYGVMSVPTVYIFQDGKEVDKFVGFHSKSEIEAILKKIK